jgi:type II secretory pathway pseudopilin PulG
MTAKTTVLVIAVTAALLGCRREDSDTKGKPRVTSPAIDTLIAAVPGNALALGFVDMDSPPWTFLTGGALPLDEVTRKTLDKELRDYVDRYLGVDLSKLQYAVGFVSGPPLRGAILLKTIGGTLKMPGAMDHEGGTVWVVDPGAGLTLAIKGEVVVFGKDQAVRDVLDTLAGKRQNVTVENKALVDWIRKESEGAAVAFAAIAPKDLPLPPQIAGLQRVAVSIGRKGIRAVVDGDDAAISSLQGLSDQAFAKMLAESESAREAAIAGNIAPPEGALAIIGAAYAKSYAVKLKPRRDGNRLSVSLDLGLGSTDAMTVVAVMGVLSAVAIPAFMDYMKKSKKSEAALQLNKLAKNLKVYFSVNGELPKGDAPLTPAASCCGGPGGKCTVHHEDWQQPIWQALDFEIDEPNLFQYRYHSDGKTAVVEAIGDLDCDTNLITYRLDVTSSNGNATAIITEPAPNTD